MTENSWQSSKAKNRRHKRRDDMHRHKSARKQAHEYQARIVKEKLYQEYKISDTGDWIYGKKK